VRGGGIRRVVQPAGEGTKEGAIKSVDALTFGRRRARELGDRSKDALPDRVPVHIANLEHLIGSARCLDRCIGTVALYQDVGRPQNVEIIDHGRNPIAAL
jgi:hypothetical protein